MEREWEASMYFEQYEKRIRIAIPTGQYDCP